MAYAVLALSVAAWSLGVVSILLVGNVTALLDF